MSPRAMTKMSPQTEIRDGMLCVSRSAVSAREDYPAAMKTGVVCRKVRWIGGKEGREVVDYEINTALIESLNSVEKRAAIETGHEVDRSDINMRMGLADQ